MSPSLLFELLCWRTNRLSRCAWEALVFVAFSVDRSTDVLEVGMFSKVLDFEEFPKSAAIVVILFNELTANFLTGLGLLDFSSSLFWLLSCWSVSLSDRYWCLDSGLGHPRSPRYLIFQQLFVAFPVDVFFCERRNFFFGGMMKEKMYGFVWVGLEKWMN